MSESSSLSEPRKLLAHAQTALRKRDLRGAGAGFQAAANAFAGPADLLGAGHGWRGQAQVAIQLGAYDQARRALERAASLYQAGALLLSGVPGEAYDAIRLDLLEGIATTHVLDADALLRQGHFDQARTRIEQAYPLYQELGDRPGVSDLWRITARLSERERRWFEAKTAWEQVLRSRRANHDEAGQCDALIRMAEAMLSDGDTEAAALRIEQAQVLARELRDEALRGRTSIAQARLMELQHDWMGAWEKWQDALMDLQAGDGVLRGLAMVRMSRTAARVERSESGRLLEEGLECLLEADYPDAVGLVLHQLAVVTLSLGNRHTGVLAAAGAEQARGGWDPALRSLLFRALIGVDAFEAAWLMAHRHGRRADDLPIALAEERLDTVLVLNLDDEEEVEDAYEQALHEALDRPCKLMGLELDDLGSRRMALKLTGGITLSPLPGIRPFVALELIWELREGEVLRHPLTGVQSIGRGGANAVQMIWDGLASRSHCVVEERANGTWIRDLDSQHGTYIDGQMVTEEQELQAGQHLRVGETEFIIAPRQQTTEVAAIAVPLPSEA